MSRINYVHGDEEYAIPPGLWQANLRRAIKSPRGQRALRDLIAALEALPEPKLICDAMALPTGEVCAVGAYALHKAAQKNYGVYDDRQDYLEHLCGVEDDFDTEHEAKRWGMTRTMAWSIMELNDEIYGDLHSDEERHAAILRWARERLIEEKAA